MASQEHIGIVAGSGQFPVLVARGARAEGLKVFICGFKGHTDPALEAEADEFIILPLGQLNKLIEFFKGNQVQRLTLAGAIKKPKALDFKPDLRATKLFFKLRNQGDDAILRALASELESEGLTLVQAAELVPGLLAPAGVQSKRRPDDDEWESIRYGWPIGKSLGAYDIGQCLVVKQKMVVAIEALEGTDATLERAGELGVKDCIALKMSKPGQDERMDLPAIGLGTIEILARLGYTCLAYEAERTLFFDREAALALADRNKIAVVGITDDVLR